MGSTGSVLAGAVEEQQQSDAAAKEPVALEGDGSGPVATEQLVEAFLGSLVQKLAARQQSKSMDKDATVGEGLGKHEDGFADEIKNRGFPEPPQVEKQMKVLNAISPQTAIKSGTWVKSLIDSDPRCQIFDYFKPGDARGPCGFLRVNKEKLDSTSADASSFFSVWRPTSMIALRMMLEGRATGKGLNVKGKSARQGELSGFVPFLQISEEEHKHKVGTSPREARIRVFYQTAEGRETALAVFQQVLFEMDEKGKTAEGQMKSEEMGLVEHTDEERDAILKDTLFLMDDPTIELLDPIACDVYGGAYGLDMPERLFREVYIMRPDISHIEGWESGRASEPAFMDANLHATREVNVHHQAVVWQYDKTNPMNPRGLLVAYEEDVVKPVASDLDAFCVGSRNCSFEPLPPEQVELVQWLLTNVEHVMGNPQPSGWMTRWLEVLKKEAHKGFHPEIPRFGFGDPTSYRIMAGAVTKLKKTGGVRHGPECFNFYFPQELDQEYLVVWDGFEKGSWKYVDEPTLRKFLSERIDEGFSFPLNPKWVLCDPGWYELWEKMNKSAAAAASLDAWYPPDSNLRERIAKIHEAHPDGFQPLSSDGKLIEHEIDCDMADLLLERDMTLQRAKQKLKMVLLWNKLGGQRDDETLGSTKTGMGLRRLSVDLAKNLETQDRIDLRKKSVLNILTGHAGPVQATRRSASITEDAEDDEAQPPEPNEAASNTDVRHEADS